MIWHFVRLHAKTLFRSLLPSHSDSLPSKFTTLNRTTNISDKIFGWETGHQYEFTTTTGFLNGLLHGRKFLRIVQCERKSRKGYTVIETTTDASLPPNMHKYA